MNWGKAIIITLQQEVAQAVLVTPGMRGSNALSYIVHYRFLPQKLFDIPQNFFFPEPKINSRTVLLTPNNTVRASEETFFFSAIEHIMHAKKKQIKNAIGATYHLPTLVIDDLLSAMGLSSTMRPTELSLEQMVRLVDGIKRVLSQ
jgi:16S rRNA (adenine1518-N6/adenine1519-N6)-dimethyltransferase